MSTPSRYVEDRDKLTDEEYFKAFQRKLNQVVNETKVEGYSLVQGVNRHEKDAEEDEDDEEGGEVSEKEADEKNAGKKKASRRFTKDEVDSIRYVLMSKSRIDALKKAEKMVTRGQEDDAFQMYNTNDGNVVIFDMLDFIKTVKNKRKLPDRFDAALGLTMAANGNDCWMRDNELYGEDGELQEVFKGMGTMWSSLLAHSDEELGIDSTFTRPGAEEMAKQFAASAAEVAEEHGCAYPCPWNAFKKKKKKNAASAASSPSASGSAGKRGLDGAEQPAGAAKPAAKKPTGKKGAASTAAA